MAKELPYFQFEPAEYLTKDISFCSLSAQGLFINLCSYYWQRECRLTKDQFIKRFKYDTEFNELLTEGVFDLDNEGNIIIKFLDNQYENATKKSAVNSANGSKGGRPKKANINPIKSETKPKLNPNESETKGIREDNIREDKIKEEYRAFDHLSISIEDKDKLLENYTINQIDEILDSIENYKPNKKYKSLYITASKWLKKEYPNGKPKKKSFLEENNMAF